MLRQHAKTICTQKKGEKDTNKNKCNQKKKMMTKMMKGPRCAKSTPHTLYSLSSFMSKEKLLKLQEMVEKDLLYYYVLNVSKLLCSKTLECLSTPSSILPERRPAKF
jgi:hypothetical protein